MSRPQLPRFSVALAIGLIAIVATRAHAADTKAEARRHFEVGVEEAKAGAYRESLVEFTRAYELSPHFAVLYNIATANAALGDPAAALNFFERYLAEGGAAIASERRAKIETEMNRLAPRTAYLNLHAEPAAAQLTVDGVPLPPDAAGRAVRVNIGMHRLGATLAGYTPAEQTTTLASGDVAKVTLQLVPLAATSAPVAAMAPPSTPPPLSSEPPGTSPSPPVVLAIQPTPAGALDAPPRSGTARRVVGYTAAGLGLVSFAVAALLYEDAKSSRDKAAGSGCTQLACEGQGAKDWASAQSGVRSSRIALVGGGVLVAGGLALALLVPSSPSATASATSTGITTLGATIGFDGLPRVTLAGRF